MEQELEMNMAPEMGMENEMGMEETVADSILYLAEEILDKLMLVKTEKFMAEAMHNGGAGLDDNLIQCLKYKQDAMSEFIAILTGAGLMETGMSDMGMEDNMEEEEEYLDEEDAE